VEEIVNMFLLTAYRKMNQLAQKIPSEFGNLALSREKLQISTYLQHFPKLLMSRHSILKIKVLMMSIIKV